MEATRLPERLGERRGENGVEPGVEVVADELVGVTVEGRVHVAEPDVNEHRVLVVAVQNLGEDGLVDGTGRRLALADGVVFRATPACRREHCGRGHVRPPRWGREGSGRGVVEPEFRPYLRAVARYPAELPARTG